MRLPIAFLRPISCFIFVLSAVFCSRGAVVNGGFESGLSGWSADGNTYAIGNSGEPIGTDGFSCANLGTFDQTGSYIFQAVQVDPGKKYRLSFTLGANAGTASGKVCKVKVDIRTTTGTSLASGEFSAVAQGWPNRGKGFTTNLVEVMVPPNLSQVILRFDDISENSGIAVDVMLDSIAMSEIPSPSPPVIVEQPSDVSAIEGSDVSFSVRATGKGALSFQWFKGQTSIDGAVSNSLILPHVTMELAGTYSVVISNADGSVRSKSVQLEVLPRNLLSNGSFEDGLTGWDHDLAVYVIPAGVNGNSSANLGTFDQPNSFISQNFEADGCSRYSLSCATAANAVTAVGVVSKVRFVVLTKEGVELVNRVFTDISVGLPSGSNGFTRRTFEFSTPTEAQTLTLRISDASDGGGVAIDQMVDDLRLGKISSESGSVVVVPNYASEVDDAGGSAGFSVPVRSQSVYNATNISGSPILIRELRFRPDSSYVTGPFTGIVGRIEFRLSTTKKSSADLSRTFAENVGQDETLVFAGEWTIETKFAGDLDGPKELDIKLPLQKEFRYDPRLGNLLIEYRNYGRLNITFINDGAYLGGGVARVFNDGNPDAQIALSGDNSAEVVGLVSCIDSRVQPVIRTQPLSLAVRSGELAQFKVQTIGTAPIAYQWYFNNAPVAAGTESILTITNAQMSDMGEYFVIASNGFGNATSSLARLEVRPIPTIISTQPVEIDAGDSVSVPVLLDSIGLEGGLGFSIEYNPLLLSFRGFKMGFSIPFGGFSINTNQAALGRIGMSFVSFGEPFLKSREILGSLIFQSHDPLSAFQSEIKFGNVPVVSEVVDFFGAPLDAEYIGSTVTARFTGIEGDIYPLEIGDGKLRISDWVQMGRIVAGIDSINNPLVFKKADCFPPDTRGDGAVNLLDWVYSGRLVNGLSSLSSAGGPVAPPQAQIQVGAKTGLEAPTVQEIGGNTLYVSSTPEIFNDRLIVDIQADIQDEVNALTVSVLFESKQLEFMEAHAPRGAFVVNSKLAGEGKLGFALSLQAGENLGRGTVSLFRCTFRIIDNSSFETYVRLSSDVVPALIANQKPEIIPFTLRSAAIKLPDMAPKLKISITSTGYAITWDLSEEKWVLETCRNLGRGEWKPISASSEMENGSFYFSLDPQVDQLYFRLIRKTLGE